MTQRVLYHTPHTHNTKITKQLVCNTDRDRLTVGGVRGEPPPSDVRLFSRRWIVGEGWRRLGARPGLYTSERATVFFVYYYYFI